MVHAFSSTARPAADAAALLRRVGFVILMMVIPIAGLVTRRATVILVPLAIILLALAAALDGGHRSVPKGLKTLARSIGGQAAVLVLAWTALSLLWTPFAAPGSERLLHVVGTLSVALAGYLALPDRMRSANLYILPVGVAAAAVLAVLLGLFDHSRGLPGEEDSQNLERGLVLLVLLLWPSLAWLRSRRRDLEALLLAVSVALAVTLGPQPIPLVALLAGAAVYALTTASPSLGVSFTALAVAGLLALAPLIPFVLHPLAVQWLGPAHDAVASLEAWRSVIVANPARLITGYGFETALRGRAAGLLPEVAPGGALFGIWYELGLVGALAGAAALDRAIRSAGRDHPPLVPGVMAAFACAFTFASLGISLVQMWWFTGLVVLVLVFVAAERGQFRTKRPKALLQRSDRVR